MKSGFGIRSFLIILLFLCIPFPARAYLGENTVGINTHIPEPAVIDLVVDMGLPWIRVDNDWYHHTDPCSQSITFLPALNDRVQYATSAGLCVFMTLAYTPPCASLGDTDGIHLNDVPDPELYGSYVRQSVAHFRAMGVRHFGLWNEANLQQFFEGTAQDYVQNVLVPGFEAVPLGCTDAGYSDCLVLGPDLAHVGDYDVFMEDTLNFMTDQCLMFDIFTHHIYQSFDKQVWDGDSFINALEDRRFSFTRRSMMDVLTDTGYAFNGVPVFEVWITETGYRCNPATDTGEMNYQKTHYEKTMDTQLQRDWWTNTFFYEILDSGDQLDGYGITRHQGGGNYLLKPAYTYLQELVLSMPELGEGSCEPGEPEPDEKETIAAWTEPGAVTIDGDLSDWSDTVFVELTCPEDYVSLGGACGGDEDLSARFALKWNSHALYLAVEVTDDVHINENLGELLWSGDSVQAGFDMAGNGGTSYDDTDDFEYGWALSGNTETTYRWHSPTGAPAASQDFAVTRSGGTTRYEIRLEAQSLGRTDFYAGDSFRFSWVANDDDGSGRKGLLQWTSGIAQGKNPSLFGLVTLEQESTQFQDGGVGDSDGTTTGEDGSTGESDGGEEDPGTVHGTDGGCSCRTALRISPMNSRKNTRLLLLLMLIMAAQTAASVTFRRHRKTR